MLHELISNGLSFCLKHYLRKKNLSVIGWNYILCSRQHYSSHKSFDTSQAKLLTFKIDSPEFHSLITPEFKKLYELFISRNYEIRITGGAVRDILIKKQPNSLDLATTATPEQMKTLFNEEQIRILHTGGESHGTITARIDEKETFEITTLRIDVATFGRRAEVEFITDWCIDAHRRDFTINSLYLGLDGTVYDYFNGYQDLQDRKLRFIGNIEKRIKEDFLRILRYFRFFGRITLDPNDHDPDILKAIQQNVNGLSDIYGKKLWIEIAKILLGPYNYDILKTMIELGIAPHIGLPSSSSIQSITDLQERTKNRPLQPITILSSLTEDYSQMLQLGTRLNFTSYERDLGYFLISQRDDETCTLYPYQLMLLEENKNRKQLFELIEQLLMFKGEIKLLEELRNWQMPRFPVNKATFEEYGIKNSARYDRILTALKKPWINSKCSLTENQLLEQLNGIIEEDNLKYPPPFKKRKRKFRKQKISKSSL